MPGKISRRLVLDTNIASAAGLEGTPYPTAKRCRDFLDAILHICHRLIMTPELRDEWRRHELNYARKWRGAMVGKKKVEFIKGCANLDRRDTLLGLARNRDQRDAADKDSILLDAALQTDGLIASMDEIARSFFAKASHEVPEIGKIAWINPDRSEESPLEWLKQGAPKESQRLLLNRK